jgi:hypothetical protein
MQAWARCKVILYVCLLRREKEANCSQWHHDFDDLVNPKYLIPLCILRRQFLGAIVERPIHQANTGLVLLLSGVACVIPMMDLAMYAAAVHSGVFGISRSETPAGRHHGHILTPSNTMATFFPPHRIVKGSWIHLVIRGSYSSRHWNPSFLSQIDFLLVSHVCELMKEDPSRLSFIVFHA